MDKVAHNRLLRAVQGAPLFFRGKQFFWYLVLTQLPERLLKRLYGFLFHHALHFDKLSVPHLVSLLIQGRPQVALQNLERTVPLSKQSILLFTQLGVDLPRELVLRRIRPEKLSEVCACQEFEE